MQQLQDIESLLDCAITKINKSNSIEDLDTIRINYLGKKGEFNKLMQVLKNLDAQQRPIFGEKVNFAKEKIEQAIIFRKKLLIDKALQDKLAQETLDISLPVSVDIGSMHPVTRTKNRVVEIFNTMGFTLAEGPEIEDDFHNFTALNIPPDHPARAMQDTFYFKDGTLLRTHTSNVQIRTMQSGEPPFKIIAAGRVYRCDSDLTHTPMFHQLEGFMLDQGISFANLKYILDNFLHLFFERPLPTRYRSSYFPFTEPSAEVDMQCVACHGNGCRICSNSGWLEILGCGMVHPNVLASCNVDSEKYSGWAFGVGLDRLAMLKYNIPDLRMLFENDLSFLQQF
jgi:phenylalanyl-tRNA synthetase alpha chain